MKKTFLIGLLSFLILNLLIKPLYIFLDTRVIGAVGPESFGVFFPMFNFSLIFTFILDSGISLYNNRNIARHQHMLDKYLHNIFGIKLSLGLLYFVISVGWGIVLGYDSFHFFLLMLLLFNQFVLSFTTYLRSNITALQMFKTDSILSVLEKTILVIITAILLYSNIVRGEFRIEWYVYAQTVSILITFVITFFIVISKTKSFRIRLRKTYLIAILKQSYPFAILMFLMAMHFRIDTVMLERMLPDGTLYAGIYAQSYRIIEGILNNFGVMFGYLLLPIFSQMLKKKEDISGLLKLSGLLLIIPVMIISTGAFIYNKEIIMLLYGTDSHNSSLILSAQMFVLTAYSVTTIYGTLLTANSSLRLLNKLTLFSLILNIILNIYLIPRYQALGCAISGLISQSIYAILQIYACNKIFKIGYNIKLISLMIIMIILQTATGLLLKDMVPFWLGISLILGVGSAFALITGLLNLSSLYNILKEKVN